MGSDIFLEVNDFFTISRSKRIQLAGSYWFSYLWPLPVFLLWPSCILQSWITSPLPPHVLSLCHTMSLPSKSSPMVPPMSPSYVLYFISSLCPRLFPHVPSYATSYVPHYVPPMLQFLLCPLCLLLCLLPVSLLCPFLCPLPMSPPYVLSLCPLLWFLLFPSYVPICSLSMSPHMFIPYVLSCPCLYVTLCPLPVYHPELSPYVCPMPLLYWLCLPISSLACGSKYPLPMSPPYLHSYVSSTYLLVSPLYPFLWPLKSLSMSPLIFNVSPPMSPLYVSCYDPHDYW